MFKFGTFPSLKVELRDRQTRNGDLPQSPESQTAHPLVLS